jgi:transcriptional regulator
MYIPKHFEQTDERTLWELVDEHAFGTLLSVVAGEPFASHVPFLADRAAGVLHCHVARANPHWQHLASSPHVLAIFAGPHGYVSPTWYSELGGVPTWNYAVVHAHGTAAIIDEQEHKRRHVEALAAKFERRRAAPWVPSYDTRRLAGVVGIEIKVGRLEGKFKLSQHRPAAESARVIAQLAASGRDDDAALARLMRAATQPS